MSHAVAPNQLPNYVNFMESSRQTCVINTNSMIDQLGVAVQQVQSSTACCSSCDSHPLTNGNKDIKELCRILNGLFSYGLIKKSQSYWPVVKEFTSKSLIEDIKKFWQVETAKGKALAWLYHSLNDGTLEWQVRSFVENFSVLNKYYKKTAFMMDKQTLEAASMYLRGLDGVRICLKPVNIFFNNILPWLRCCFNDDHYRPRLTKAKMRQQKSFVASSNGCPVSQHTVHHNNDSASSNGGGTKSENQAQAGTNPDVVIRRPTKIGGPHCSSMQLFEQSVADFSDCPHVLGLSPVDADLILADAELSQDALEFAYPEIRMNSTNFVRLRPQKVVGKVQKAVPRMVERNDPGLENSMDSSVKDYSYLSGEFNPKEVSSSTPLTQKDAEIIFNALIKGRRPSPEGSESPPHLTPSDAQARQHSSACNSAESWMEVQHNTYIAAEQMRKVSKESTPTAVLKSFPVRSENIEICKHQDYNETAAPPNTFVPNTAAEQNGTPRSLWKDSILHRLKFVNDSISKKSSEKSSSSSLHIAETGNDVSTGQVEMQADPQTVLTQSGEVLLESGEILELTVNVMKPGEGYYKMFRVFCNHHHGNPSLRYFLLTNSTFYLLTDKASKDDPSSSYQVDFRVPYGLFDYISVGLNGQMFTIHLRQTRQTIVVCTASESYTRSVLSNLELAVRRASAHDYTLQPASVLTDATPQKIYLNKWILGEIGLEDNTIYQYSLIYWNPNVSATDCGPSGGPNRNGYLYIREFYPNGWIKKSTDWEQSYFMLRGKKFYQFEDLSCKIGKKVFDLQDQVIGCRQAETKEHSYCIELIMHDNSVIVQLAAPTKHELQQWLHAFIASFSQSELAQVSCSCLACCAVITNKFLLLGQETTTIGFVRTLAISRLDTLVELKISKKFNSLILTVPSSTLDMGEHWLLSFICDLEMESFLSSLKTLNKSLLVEELPEDCDGEHLIKECQQHWTNVKQS